MSTEQRSGFEILIDAYCEAWSEADTVERAARLEAACPVDVTYTDPATQVRGRDALAEHIALVLARRPGARVVRTTRVDAHHRVGRFGWQLVQADGTRLPEGLDVVELTNDGKILRIVGFFGPLR